MAGYTRAPNVSRYIANLNSISNGQEANELGNLDDDLAYFTNTELFDFDLGGGESQAPQSFHEEAKQAPIGDVSNGNAVNFDGGEYNFFNGQSLELNTQFPFDPQLVQSPQSATFSSQQQEQTQSQQETSASALPSNGQGQAPKRTLSVSSPALEEDSARMAADEDKRRRNTAASARFRVKKKQREAALEKTAKEMTDKVDQLQKRVSELEMENKWLRELVVEKGNSVKTEDGETSSDNSATAERIPKEQGKKGVGTGA